MKQPAPLPPRKITLTARAFELRSQFEREIALRGLARITRETYLRVVTNYLEFSRGALTRDTLMGYLETPIMAKASGTTRHHTMVILKVFYETTPIKWPLRKNEIPKKSRPSRPYLLVSDAERLLRAAQDAKISDWPELDHALLRLMIVLGCRREELSRMLLSDYKKPKIVVRTAKGGEMRTRLIDLQTCNALGAYLKVRDSETHALFVSHLGRPLSAQMIGQRFAKLARAIGLPKGTGPHAARRGAVTWLYSQGMREREIQEAIGWRSPMMVHEYIQLESGPIDAMVSSKHPFMQPKPRKKKSAPASEPAPAS